MIDIIFEYFTDALTYGFWFSLSAAFVWGLLSIVLSPCHLSSIPLVVGYLTSMNETSIRRTFFISFAFTMGILVTILLIGIITALTGQILGDIGKIGNILVSVVFILIGLYLMDVLKIPIPGMNIKSPNSKGYLSSFILGLLFGLGLGPCTFAFMAPVIVIVFKISSTNLMHGLLLIVSFATCHCILIIAAGVSFVKVQNFLNWNENSRAVGIIKSAAGVLVIFGGIYLLYNYVI